MKRAPRHQNTFAFKHNPNSKKTEKILSYPIEGVCERCYKQIEWRKTFRKYKPLTQLKSCVYCHQKSIKSAYHAACHTCTKERNVCAKCCQEKPLSEESSENPDNTIDLSEMKERERRSYLRKLQKENSRVLPEQDVFEEEEES